MTPLAELLADRIRANGPIAFRSFMESALYHPEHGYYRRGRDPFGKAGDYFTAEQIQPVFGILMAQRIRQLRAEMGDPGDFSVVELGAGRREMAEAFAEWNYAGVDLDGGALAERFSGVIFSNEFFDALPVDAAVYTHGEFRERRVGFADGRFRWTLGERAPEEAERYCRAYFPPPEEGRCYEASLEALRWLDRIAGSLEDGYVLSVDYGITRAESIRFPEGTLMGYHRHTAREDVLEEPGERDITAHVNFTALEEHGAKRGLEAVKFETLARTIAAADESDRFARALGAEDSRENLRRRLQLKTLLFGMGETFRTLLQRKRRVR